MEEKEAEVEEEAWVEDVAVEVRAEKQTPPKNAMLGSKRIRKHAPAHVRSEQVR